MRRHSDKANSRHAGEMPATNTRNAPDMRFRSLVACRGSPIRPFRATSVQNAATNSVHQLNRTPSSQEPCKSRSRRRC
ncbi:hypothetical protein HMPREF0724_10363 [Prescottella equi ATCC 33707]|uniref:Uncharacterized protein n=1 Tax=Prescottella equi ATCC 33707 TaxID=525370 RepID=E9SW63_RHOHA|nr:hypothetical protein HMPREF0724_10363 [Prescottella equi ATCC 33707]